MERPVQSDYRVIRSAVGEHVFAVNGSRLFDIDSETAQRVGKWFGSEATDHHAAEQFRATFASERQYIDETIPDLPSLRAVSLNVAQACNLGCRYCYADAGLFGGKARIMSIDTARRSVDRLLAESDPRVDIVLGFMGGEPMLNRNVVHDATYYASKRARESGRRVGFSITTNATLIKAEDAQLFRDYDFAVTVSIDGPKAFNDEMRPCNNGSSSYDATLKGLALILAGGGPGHTSARITVTPKTRDLLAILEHVIDLGVGDAGFAPVQVSPNPALQFQREDFERFLKQMIRCGDASKAALMQGERFPFSNFETAMNEIHRGSHRPYPCGAGAGYLSLNADGEFYGCHRLVDSEGWEMGNIAEGSEREARRAHLARRHVDKQEPCRSCWARYLCGGGCYHEVDQRGRIHCDYVRGWLEYCIAAYAELSAACPGYFLNPDRHFETSAGKAL